MSFEEEQREIQQDRFIRLIRHELGHHLMARIVGFDVGDLKFGQGPLEMYGPGGFSQTTMVRPLRSREDIIKYCKDRVKVAFAGVLAGEMEYGKVVEHQSEVQLTNGGGRDDYTKVIENVHLLRNMLYPDSDLAQAEKDVKAILDELWDESVAIINTEAVIIQTLADEFLAKHDPKKGATMYTAAELAAHPLMKQRFGG